MPNNSSLINNEGDGRGLSRFQEIARLGSSCVPGEPPLPTMGIIILKPREVWEQMFGV